MLRVILLLKWKSLGSQLQYRANFVTYVIGVGLGGCAEIVMILALTSTFHTIGGWGFMELGFMFSLFRLSYAVYMAVFLPFLWHSSLVRRGDLDRYLVRPVHPILQILAYDLHLCAIGILLPALVLFGMTVSRVVVPWTVPNILFLLVIIGSGAVIQWAVVLFLNAFDFWFVQAQETLDLLDPLQYNATRYPTHIYRRVFSFLLTYVLPYAFIGYFPAHYFLGLKVELGAAWFTFLSPVVAGALAAIAIAFWSYSLRHYQSTGT